MPGKNRTPPSSLNDLFDPMWTLLKDSLHPRLSGPVLGLVVMSALAMPSSFATSAAAQEPVPAEELAPAEAPTPADDLATADDPAPAEAPESGDAKEATEKPLPVLVPEAAAGEPEAVPITPEEEGPIRAFIAARDKWADTLVEMKAASIRFSNKEGNAEEHKKTYRELRDRARGEMNVTFDRAMDLLRVRKGDYEAGAMVATMLEYRASNSIYENSYEAAEMMLEAEVTYPFVYQIAARSALLEGKYDRVMKHYNAFVELHGYEKLKDVDKMIASIVDVYPKFWDAEKKLLEAEAKADDLPRVLLQTSRGPVTVELFENEAPNTVANFIQLVEEGYYDGADFYQVVDDFLAMGGDPVGDGSSTSGKFIPDEHEHPQARQMFRGYLVMAKVPDPRDPKTYVANSASSQFAIALMPMIRENRPQTVFGRVIEGMDVVSSFRRVDPTEKKEKSMQLPPDRIETAKVLRKRDHEYKVEYVK